MDKMKDEACNLEQPNNLTPNNSPIGYPDMSGKLPESYAKKNPPNRVIKYQSGTLSHSVNKEPTFASADLLNKMKLVK